MARASSRAEVMLLAIILTYLLRLERDGDESMPSTVPGA
jgi:hypothetical protein